MTSGVFTILLPGGWGEATDTQTGAQTGGRDLPTYQTSGWLETKTQVWFAGLTMSSPKTKPPVCAMHIKDSLLRATSYYWGHFLVFLWMLIQGQEIPQAL